MPTITLFLVKSLEEYYKKHSQVQKCFHYKLSLEVKGKIHESIKLGRSNLLRKSIKYQVSIISMEEINLYLIIHKDLRHTVIQKDKC